MTISLCLKDTVAELGHRRRPSGRAAEECPQRGRIAVALGDFCMIFIFMNKVLEPVSRTAEHADNSRFQVNTSSYHSPLNYIVITLKKRICDLGRILYFYKVKANVCAQRK